MKQTSAFASSPTDFLSRLASVLPRLRTPLQLTGFVVLVGAVVILGLVGHQQLTAQVTAGAIGVLCIIFGQVFNFLHLIPIRRRAGYILALFFGFLIFVAVLTVLTLIQLAPRLAVSVAIPAVSTSRLNQSLNPISRVNITYSTTDNLQVLFNDLDAMIEGHTYRLIAVADEMCLKVLDQRDFDGDGSTDVLVQHIVACGGNGAEDSFFFYSYAGKGHFEKTKEFGYSSTPPVVEMWNGRWSVVVTSNNEGVNTYRPGEVTERYVLDSGRAVKVEESVRKELVALMDMRSEQFDLLGSNEPRRIVYDLDGDGGADVIEGKLWERWGRILWTVQFANGARYEGDVNCKRLGILATKTEGVNDLVCDHDDILKWNGSGYVTQLTPEDRFRL